jgi:hypothetical protein
VVDPQRAEFFALPGVSRLGALPLGIFLHEIAATRFVECP